MEVKSPEPGATESLSLRAIPKSGGKPTPLPLSPKRDLKPASHEATSPFPKTSQGACLISEAYLPFCELLKWRKRLLKRLPWRTSGSLLDSSYPSRKGNPSINRLSNRPHIPVHNVLPLRGDAMLATSPSSLARIKELSQRTPLFLKLRQSSFSFPHAPRHCGRFPLLPIFLLFSSCTPSLRSHLLLLQFVHEPLHVIAMASPGY